MLDLLPAEILLAIIDTPEVYRLVSQVVMLGNSVIRGAKHKFALSIHKKQFKSVLYEINAIEHRYNNISTEMKNIKMCTTFHNIKTTDGSSVFGMTTNKHVLLEPYNWVVDDERTLIRKTDSYCIACGTRNKNIVMLLNHQDFGNRTYNQISGWASVRSACPNIL